MTILNDLAIKNGSPTWQLPCGSDDAWIVVAPIKSVPGVGSSGTALDHKHGPVAGMLGLVKPVGAYGRLAGQAGKLWRDKAKAGHSCLSSRTGANCESSGWKE